MRRIRKTYAVSKKKKNTTRRKKISKLRVQKGGARIYFDLFGFNAATGRYDDYLDFHIWIDSGSDAATVFHTLLGVVGLPRGISPYNVVAKYRQPSGKYLVISNHNPRRDIDDEEVQAFAINRERSGVIGIWRHTQDIGRDDKPDRKLLTYPDADHFHWIFEEKNIAPHRPRRRGAAPAPAGAAAAGFAPPAAANRPGGFAPGGLFGPPAPAGAPAHAGVFGAVPGPNGRVVHGVLAPGGGLMGGPLAAPGFAAGAPAAAAAPVIAAPPPPPAAVFGGPFAAGLGFGAPAAAAAAPVAAPPPPPAAVFGGPFAAGLGFGAPAAAAAAPVVAAPPPPPPFLFLLLLLLPQML
jgi:hypothetical protein